MDLETIARIRGGYFVRADLMAAGLSAKALTAMLKSGHAVRIRRGAYVFAEPWNQLDRFGRYVVRCLAVADKLGPAVALCGISSAAVQGMPLVGHDLSYVHVVRLDGQTGRKEAGVRHHTFMVTDDDLVEVDGRKMTAPVRAIWEAGVEGSTRSALVLMDNGLYLRRVTRDDLERTGEVFASWKGSPAPREALRLADGRAESPGETLTRWMCHAFDLPVPDLQFIVTDAYGREIGRADFAWHEHRLLGEFDGTIKYQRGFDPNKPPEQVVMDERKRERELCGERYGMIRFVWGEVFDPRPPTIQRVRAELTWSRRRYRGGA